MESGHFKHKDDQKRRTENNPFRSKAFSSFILQQHLKESERSNSVWLKQNNLWVPMRSKWHLAHFHAETFSIECFRAGTVQKPTSLKEETTELTIDLTSFLWEHAHVNNDSSLLSIVTQPKKVHAAKRSGYFRHDGQQKNGKHASVTHA